MTQKMIVLCAAAFTCMVAASSCYAQTQVGQMINGVPVITVNIDSLKIWMASQLDAGTIINEVELQVHANTFDLVGHGINGPNSRVIAVDVGRDGDVFRMRTVTVTNTCAGSQCESCDMVRNGDGNIMGCSCLSGFGGACNHVRTETYTK